jgi:Iap family predicted aminopeptidase
MRISRYVAVGIVWLLSLVAVAAAVTAAQALEYRALPEPRVMTGGDVGFKVEGLYGNMPAGSIVIRVNGEWIEARVGTPSTPGLGTR